MNVGQVEYAERRAKELFDRWNDATGVFTPGTGYYAEVCACIEDAVHCGIQMALYGKIKIHDGRMCQPRRKIMLRDEFYKDTSAVERFYRKEVPNV